MQHTLQHTLQHTHTGEGSGGSDFEKDRAQTSDFVVADMRKGETGRERKKKEPGEIIWESDMQRTKELKRQILLMLTLEQGKEEIQKNKETDGDDRVSI